MFQITSVVFHVKNMWKISIWEKEKIDGFLVKSSHIYYGLRTVWTGELNSSCKKRRGNGLENIHFFAQMGNFLDRF